MDTETLCPMCGHQTVTEFCNALGCEDGWIAVYEDDPLWYEPDEMEQCEECNGKGYHHWCPNCGVDMRITEQTTPKP
jgi:hypothetical protein